MEYKDYYKTLGVEKTATKDEIKKSYRRLARKYHPDVSKETNAEEKFKDVQEAYKVLNNEEKRQSYDHLGSSWQGGDQFKAPPDWQPHGFDTGGFSGAGARGAGGFSDFFEDLFGGQGQDQGFGGRGARGHQGGFATRGQDVNAKVSISLEEAYNGGERQFTLTMPELSNGHMVNRQKTLKVKIPAGIKSGQQIRLKGQGNPGSGGAASGDLFIEVGYQAHLKFTIKDNDVYLSMPVTPWEAALGATVQVLTLSGKLGLKIPAGSQGGQKMRLKGKGMPGKTPGNQYVVLKIAIPKADSDEKRELYEKMASIMAFNPREG